MNKYFRCLSVFVILFSFLTPRIFSQPATKGGEDISAFARGALKVFTPNEGLPQSSIMALATDSSGRLWIGTQDGAAYYNGRKWTIVNLPNRTTSNYVQSMFVASDGAIWFSANRGQVHRYMAGHWQSFDISDGLASTMVRSIQETNDEHGGQVLWFGTSRGISKYSRGQWQTFNTGNSTLMSDHVYDICKSADGTLWVATDRGASRYVDGAFQNVELPQGLRDTAVDKILQAKDGALWFAGNGIVGRYANMNWALFRVMSTKTSNSVNALYESSAGDMWVGMQSGIAQIRKGLHAGASGVLEDFVVGTMFENEMGDVFCIHEIRADVIWFGTLLGLYRHVPGRWKTLDERTGLTNTAITSICETSSGDYFFGTPRGLFQYHNGAWKLFDNKSGLANNFVKAILEARNGALWIGTLGGGVQRLSNGRWQHFDEHNGLADNRVYSILQSHDSTLWFATARGLSKYSQGTWAKHTSADGLAGDQVMSLYESSDGALWCGTRSGLSRLYKGMWRSFTAANGLCGDVVHSINSASDGSLWFGTASSGISQFSPSNQAWKTLNDTSSPALPNNIVHQVQEDRQGRLYFLTNKGVTRLSKNLVPSIEARENLPTEVFTMEDGLPNNEGIVRASIVDSRGRIWVGTTKGPAYFDPADEKPDTLQKPLMIERVTVQNLSPADLLHSGIELTYSQNNLWFEYALISLFKEQETRYQTQLYPYDKAPSLWTGDFKKEYTNLSEGTYAFRVWGKDYAGNITGPEEFRFIIRPPFWKTWWFRGLSVLLLVGVVTTIVRVYTAYNVRKQMALMEQQRLIEHERYRISQDMHDSVGSSLTRIAVLSDGAKIEIEKNNVQGKAVEGIRGKVTSIGETAREVIDTMNEIIWSLSPRYDTLESLINYMRIYVNTMLDSDALRCSLNIQHSIPHVSLTPDVRRNIFLIFKEAVNNLVKYSSASEVTITVTIVDHVLAFTIQDNGIGFGDQASNGKTRSGSGLVNMRERATRLGAKLDIASELGKGTTIRLEFSLSLNVPQLRD